MMQLECQYGREFILPPVIHSYLTDVIGQLQIQQQQQQHQQKGRVVGGDRATAPRRRCRGISVTSATEDDVRPRIISESQISETISQTNMHGSNYHESKRPCRP